MFGIIGCIEGVLQIVDGQAKLIRDHALLVACPKLDDFKSHQRKLNDILRYSDLKRLTVVHMEVPCCSRLSNMAKQAIGLSGKDIPFNEATIGIRGDLKS